MKNGSPASSGSKYPGGVAACRGGGRAPIRT
ncbi:hypothetical protein RKLH11_2889 [Rhodobacteraceae bacterium KLH11]|nr:hypothetical protein RKLH11_2889 [Rhodobacteraceae bacterium KLH11]